MLDKWRIANESTGVFAGLLGSGCRSNRPRRCESLCGENSMTTLSRRHVLRTGAALAIPPGMMTLITGCNQSAADPPQPAESNADGVNRETQESNPQTDGEPMHVHYLEIVTPKVEALCDQYSKIHDVTFSEPDPNLGGARTAKLEGGGFIAIRGPLRETETPVIRPYTLVENLAEAVAAAADAGAEIAIQSMEIPGHGTIAVVIQGGIECGLWQR